MSFLTALIAHILRRHGDPLSRLLGVVLLVALSAAPVSAQSANPERPVALAHAGSEVLFKASADALFRSADAGRSWTRLAWPELPGGSISAIAARTESGSLYVAGPGTGIFRSDDSGASWTAIDSGLPSRDVTAVALHATQPDTIYAYLPANGIYRSQDAGKTWKLMDRGPEGIRSLIHTDMAGSMETGWLYAGTSKGARISMDCFCLWRDAEGLSGEVYSLAFQPGKPERLYAASEQGLFRTDSGGRDWQKVKAPESPLTALAITPAGGIYAAGADGTLFSSSDHAETWDAVGG